MLRHRHCQVLMPLRQPVPPEEMLALVRHAGLQLLRRMERTRRVVSADIWSDQRMADPATSQAASRQEFLAFAQQVFQLARSGDATTLARLLDKGLSPNMSNHKGDTLLMLAAYHGHVEATQALLQAGADPERYNDMAQTPLGAAAYKGDLPIVEALLAHGARPDFAPPGGKTPSMFAAMFNRVDVLKVLVAQGADLDAQSSEGLSALELAAKMGAVDTVAFLQARATRQQAA